MRTGNKLSGTISSLMVIFACVLLSGCVEPESSPEAERPPNVVFILADDLGWSQLGAYGSDYYKTPHIDQLAAEGAKFTNAYAAAAVCSPTRASIMTGKHPARLRITDFIPGGPERRGPLVEPEWQKYLPLSENTIGEMFRSSGYRTALFGKWHLSKTKVPPGSESHNPQAQGFDESFVTYKPSPELAKEWQTPEQDGHNVQILSEKAIDFVSRNVDRPFFLMVSHNTIHDPLIEKRDAISRYLQDSNSERPENNPVLGAMIETLDDSVGSILGAIDEHGLAGNTIVIFYSDNGGLKSAAAQTPLREGKAWLYEGGIRVPLIVRWPDKITAGKIIDMNVSSIDFAPTFREILDFDVIPDQYDGISLLRFLTTNDHESREPLFWHYPHYHNAGMAPASAVRFGDHKLIAWYEPADDGTIGARTELYNLSDDISEQRDLAEEQPAKRDELLSYLEEWKTSVNAQEPTVLR